MINCELITYIQEHLSKEGPIPLYQQILNLVRAYIASGGCPPGTRLPTEAEFEAELGVSRVTVRQAMSMAFKQGVVVRVAGKGTYVAGAPGTNQKQSFVGYIVHHLSSSFNSQILLGAENVLKTTGYYPIFCNSDGNQDTENRLLRSLQMDNIVGFIIQAVHSETQDSVLAELTRGPVPVILLDREVPGIQADLVTSDHFEGGRAIVRHLIEQGYTDIVYLAHRPLQLYSISERLRGYRHAMREAGLTPREPFPVGDPIELGYDQSHRTLSIHEDVVFDTITNYLLSPERPQALVAANDGIALIVMEAAERVNLRVPGDLALVGYDDLDFASIRNLTTVDQDPYHLGIEAANQLLRRIRGDRDHITRVVLPAKIVIRGSSIKPHQ
jgi:DNA-binding LacI/PurR family transcriptional regulator